MALAIDTFDKETGGHPFFKAVGHPLAAPLVRALVDDAGRRGPVAVYDPLGHARDLFAMHPPDGWVPAVYLVQRLEDLGRDLLGLPARPVGATGLARVRTVLLAAFDAERFAADIRALLPPGANLVTLDSARLPDALLGVSDRYLDPLNFATNIALFRDGEGQWTRLTTANYWAGYGAVAPALWLRLFDADGHPLATWREELGATPRAIVIDSREVRARFGLPPFAGSLFVHAVGIAGHDAVKYALDFGDGGAVSTTHDANAFPADRYAGLPAPAPGERVVLWLQNSHPLPIPAGAIGLAAMGSDAVAPFPGPIPPFGTRAVDVGALLPGLAWPRQVEIHAGRYLVRPRYEVLGPRARAIAHANVERTDLAPDPGWTRQGDAIGKGPLVVAPILDPGTWRTEVLPTPMATGQRALPLIVRTFAPDGRELGRRWLGTLPRDHGTVVNVDDLAGGAHGGHLELAYDLADGTAVDGWLHALFRYRRRDGRGLAETSFGAHLFNLPVTFRGEPQSYAGRPPGLSTRLFLRIAAGPADTICTLIYPSSGTWRPVSETQLLLLDAAGAETARRNVAIPLNGSHRWSVADTFDADERRAAGGGYVVVRDRTCRLFGYHGIVDAAGRCSLDHLFGF